MTAGIFRLVDGVAGICHGICTAATIVSLLAPAIATILGAVRFMTIASGFAGNGCGNISPIMCHYFPFW